MSVFRIICITCVIAFISSSTAAQDSRAESQSARVQDTDDFKSSDDFKSGTSTWMGALEDSLRLLTLEHATRIAFQQKTRRELGGPFFSDYVHSLKVPRTWGDGDSWDINYIGHPIHGAASGFIWLDHERGVHDPKLGFSKAYWASRSRATLWAAFYSLQFEIGPLSEASIGNVGMNPRTTGWVDHIVTPLGAFGIIVTEDVLDRYVIRKLETSTDKRPLQIFFRIMMNPSRSLSNLALGRPPWARDDRRLR